MNIYLDIDGVILANDKQPALHAKEFLKYITDNYPTYWLTTHCKGVVAAGPGFGPGSPVSETGVATVRRSRNKDLAPDTILPSLATLRMPLSLRENSPLS